MILLQTFIEAKRLKYDQNSWSNIYTVEHILALKFRYNKVIDISQEVYKSSRIAKVKQV